MTPVAVHYPAVRSIHLLLTTACNLRCAYCYQARRPPHSMDWRILRRTIDWALQQQDPETWMVFSGGEPLLAWSSIERAVTYAEQQAGRKWPLRYRILTNGMLLDDSIAEFLGRRRFDVQLSFDGVAAAQTLRGRDTFTPLDSLLNRLRRTQRALFQQRLTIAITVLPETVPHLARSVEYFIRKGIRQIALAPTIADSSAWEAKSIRGLEAEFARICELSRAHYDRCGRIPVMDFRVDTGRAQPTARAGILAALPGDRAMCGAMSGRTPAVDVDGSVYGCAMLVAPALTGMRPWLAREAKRLRIGSLDDPHLAARMKRFRERAWRSSFMAHKEEKSSSYRRCAKCRYLPACVICPLSIGLQRGNGDPRRIPDFNCAFTRAAGKMRRRFARTID